MSCPIYGMASSEGVEKAQRGSNSKLIKPTVTVYISPEVAAQVTDQEIDQLIRGAAAKDGDTIIIYDVGYASSDDKDALQGSSERLGRYNYPTSYSYGTETSVYKGYKQDKIEMRGDRAEMSDFPLYLNTVAGGLDRRDQTIGGFSFVVKIYAVPVVEIIG